MFGHTISLNFDQQGSDHLTFIGGVFSILIKIFMTVYVSLNLYKLIFREDDDTVIFLKVLNGKEIEEGIVHYKDSNVRPLYSLKKLHGGEQVYFPCLST